jgi:hypothetical protein
MKQIIDQYWQADILKMELNINLACKLKQAGIKYIGVVSRYNL